MKSHGRPLAAFLLLVHLIAFPAHARIFPTGLDNKQITSGHHEKTLKMIIGSNYWRPARSPPPSPIQAPTRHQSSRSASTVDPDCDNDAADQYQATDFDNINVVENKKCQRVVLARSPPPRPVETQSLVETIIITSSASTTNPRRRHYGPTAAAEAEKFGKDYPSPPPPPRGSTPTGHLTPITLCLPGRPCGGSLKTTSSNNIS